MRKFTDIIGAAPGIQYQGVMDANQTPQENNLQNAIFVGSFRRGRLDRPFPVTINNVDIRLGEDLNNIVYQAIIDTLDTGVSQVLVQRIRGRNRYT
jgi:hypothetical protein